MMGMAPFIGRQQAHDIVYDACRTVNEKGGTLAEVLAALPDVTDAFRPRRDRSHDRPRELSRPRAADGRPAPSTVQRPL